MLRPWRRAASLGVCLLLSYAGSGFAQDWNSPKGTRPGGERAFSFFVRDSGGMPLRGAVAILGDVWVEESDSQGLVRFEGRPGVHLPVVIHVWARGYHSRSILWDGMEKSTEVYLERDEKFLEGPAAGGAKTVSVTELSPEHQRLSKRLQDEAIAALARNENQHAEQLLRKAVGLTPSSSSAQNNLGVALLRQGKIDEATPYFERGYEIQPLDATAAGNLGLIRWMQRRHDESYLLLDRAVALGFTAPTANYYLGILALGRSRWKQAIEQLNRTNPERFPYRDLYRSFALRGLGEERQASQTFLQFIRRVPAALFRFAWILGRSDDDPSALALGHK